jgi:hypothetical protein
MKKRLYILLITIISIPAWAQNPTSLMAWYPCTGNFNDQSGNARHGTVTGAVLSADKHGNVTGAYTFDGVDDYVTLPILGPYTSFTLMTRVKFTSTELMNIFSGYEAGWYPSVFAGKVRWYDGTDWRVTSTAINNNQWHDIAYIFNNGTYSLYVDGVIEYTGVGAASITTGRVSILGKVATVSMRFFQGSLDDIRIYNTALNSNDISQVFNGYPIVWSELKNVVVNADNSITKNPVNAQWDAAAVSENVLSPNQDGSMSFTFTGLFNSIVIGLSWLNNSPAFTLTNYGVYIVNTSMWIMESGSQKTPAATPIILAQGDVIKISREGTTIRYYRNNVVVYTSATPSLTHLRVDASLYTASVPAITCTFDRAFMVKPQFQYPGLDNSAGSISLQTNNQYDPVTYSWSTGETTSSVTSKPRGAYTVTATDAQNRSVVKTFQLGYPIAWTNLTNVLVNADNSLTKADATTTWNCGASSLNLLPANTDGWIELIVNEPTTTYMIGLSRIDKDVTYPSIAYSWHVSNLTGIYNIFESGVSTPNVGYLMKGDVLRIARVGATIKYYINGIERRSVATTTSWPLLVDVSVNYNTGPTPVVQASFDKQIRVLPSLTFPNTNNSGGSIALNVQGTHTPAAVNWSSGENSTIISNKSRGTYTVTISDAASRTFTRSYRLGYAIDWTDLQNTQANGNNVIYKSIGEGNSQWDASAVSSNVLSPGTDGWIEFVLPPVGGQVMIGLARPNSVAFYSSIDYAFYFLNEDVRIYELGANKVTVASQAEGDVYAIAREGSLIKYYINGAVVRTVATNPSYSLVADVSILRGSASVISSSFGRASQTFYSIASGNWTYAGNWSLSEGGVPATMYPSSIDEVHIKGYTMLVNSGTSVGSVTITAINDNTCLKIDGVSSSLTVRGGEVTIKGENNANTVKALLVQNGGKISVQPPPPGGVDN